MLRGGERKEKSPSGSRAPEGRHGRSGACPLPAAPVGMVGLAPRRWCQPAHTWGWPPASVPQPRPGAAATHGGSAQVGPPWTPARAAGWTEPVWTRQEGRLLRGPRGPYPQAVERGRGGAAVRSGNRGTRAPQKPEARAEHRLLPTMRTVCERARHIRRTMRVHDPTFPR